MTTRALAAARWSAHTPMSDPGERTPMVKHLPADIGAISRDYALALCSFLRVKEFPARLRCGCASYLGPRWEDHWLCEYFDRDLEEWRLADAQLDAVLRRRLHIAFDPANVPRPTFLTAGEAWSACRQGRADPQDFGHGEDVGLWFIRVNAMRDHYALNGRETSPWDDWRAAPPAARVVMPEEIALVDRLSGNPAATLREREPNWVRRGEASIRRPIGRSAKSQLR